MLRSGDVVVADLGQPAGREAGFTRPVVVVTAETLAKLRETIADLLDV